MDFELNHNAQRRRRKYDWFYGIRIVRSTSADGRMTKFNDFFFCFDNNWLVLWCNWHGMWWTDRRRKLKMEETRPQNVPSSAYEILMKKFFSFRYFVLFKLNFTPVIACRCVCFGVAESSFVRTNRITFFPTEFFFSRDFKRERRRNENNTKLKCQSNFFHDWGSWMILHALRSPLTWSISQCMDDDVCVCVYANREVKGIFDERKRKVTPIRRRPRIMRFRR